MNKMKIVKQRWANSHARLSYCFDQALSQSLAILTSLLVSLYHSQNLCTKQYWPIMNMTHEKILVDETNDQASVSISIAAVQFGLCDVVAVATQFTSFCNNNS